MASVLQSLTSRDRYFAWIQPAVYQSPNHEWLSYMLASWCDGLGELPVMLGMPHAEFEAMQQQFFPNIELPKYAYSGKQADFSRMLEKEDLVNLLLQHRRHEGQEINWMISVLVAGCLGSDHLWQDLGLWSRTQLSALMAYNFPGLAAKNDKDMKWKKFLYKQLCEAEGIYICRAPSCDVCIDYSKCYGAE